MIQKIYISGQITGIEKEAPLLFAEAEIKLIKKGFKVINPMTLNHKNNSDWLDYMKKDIKALMDCNIIYMLDNWTSSKGAKIERKLAIDLGIKVIYETQ